MGFFVSLALIMFLELLDLVAHSQCNSGHHFDCGKLRNVASPFWTMSRNPTQCSNEDFKLFNCDNETEFPSISIQQQKFIVKNISQESNTMRLSLPFDDPCALADSPQTLSKALRLRLVSSSTLYVFCRCDNVKDLPESGKVQCRLQDWIYCGMEANPSPSLLQSCKNHFEIAVMNDTTRYNSTNHKLITILHNGFEVRLSLPLPATSSKSGKGGSGIRTKLILGFKVSGGTALIMCGIFVIYQLRRKCTYYTRNISSDPSSSAADSEKMGALYGVKHFTFEELEEATDNFSKSREIGDGGFGTVYLGKLHDGRTVAVKRLYENNFKRVEQFLNEVEILARVRHKNLVMLYGCTSRHRRELLLVYEYVSNGTVADHLHGERVKPGSVSWPTRLKIAVETASALKYLHASDIIHRDVKTNNILVDDNFSVKVADFGLSRLFPLDVTHVSTSPQGTPGYVDPEYRQCYQLTDKSDVYSFGVVLAELISSKPAVDITRHRHEINLSTMAINKIQTDALHGLVDPLLGFDRDSNVRKMITAVAELAFQCLQGNKDMRPSMAEVLDILTRIQLGEPQTEDNAEELDIFSDSQLSPDSIPAKCLSSSDSSNGKT